MRIRMSGNSSAASSFCQYCYVSEKAFQLLTNNILYLSYSKVIFTARNMWYPIKAHTFDVLRLMNRHPDIKPAPLIDHEHVV